ncbi:hypothetical protein SAMN05216176_1197 [Nitratireductor indicus]|uniref:hypothetical protein n=1 Tax=Nitratireductor indicus TaxID=721133 RepID=UPI0008E1650F|nr:hypothetical protein [Nitratireductor indicus]SFQ80883.1 hypothetical protein SAMN05216176_1197 [Nitratireductor indicus]
MQNMDDIDFWIRAFDKHGNLRRDIAKTCDLMVGHAAYEAAVRRKENGEVILLTKKAWVIRRTEQFERG